MGDDHESHQIARRRGVRDTRHVCLGRLEKSAPPTSSFVGPRPRRRWHLPLTEGETKRPSRGVLEKLLCKANVRLTFFASILKGLPAVEPMDPAAYPWAPAFRARCGAWLMLISADG